jgi:Tfp pilus assembly protein PilF
MESEINRLGYRVMGAGHLEDAMALFELNVAEFPDSWNAYDSLAEAFETAGKPDRALELYRKSLSLNPSSPTGLAAIERLRGSDDKRHDEGH